MVDVGALARLEMSAAGPFAHGSRGAVGRRGIPGLNSFGAVSYTHLTLPTILRV